jgi:hypothetical protein
MKLITSQISVTYVTHYHLLLLQQHGRVIRLVNATNYALITKSTRYLNTQESEKTEGQ